MTVICASEEAVYSIPGSPALQSTVPLTIPSWRVKALPILNSPSSTVVVLVVVTLYSGLVASVSCCSVPLAASMNDQVM